jgi:hypothetical protein
MCIAWDMVTNQGISKSEALSRAAAEIAMKCHLKAAKKRKKS